MKCPVCHEETTFTIGRAITVWQTLRVRIDEGGEGISAVEDDDLHDTLLSEGAIEDATCDHCDSHIPLGLLGLTNL